MLRVDAKKMEKYETLSTSPTKELKLPKFRLSPAEIEVADSTPEGSWRKRLAALSKPADISRFADLGHILE
jgi:hypothetical protein